MEIQGDELGKAEVVDEEGEVAHQVYQAGAHQRLRQEGQEKLRQQDETYYAVIQVDHSYVL